MKKRFQRNQESHIAFIDLEKAYDSVPVNYLWGKMEELKINPTLIRAIGNLYKANTLKIKINNNVSDRFEISKGLRQGCSRLQDLFG